MILLTVAATLIYQQNEWLTKVGQRTPAQLFQSQYRAPRSSCGYGQEIDANDLNMT
jgi:hypothetical protein